MESQRGNTERRGTGQLRSGESRGKGRQNSLSATAHLVTHTDSQLGGVCKWRVWPRDKRPGSIRAVEKGRRALALYWGSARADWTASWAAHWRLAATSFPNAHLPKLPPPPRLSEGGRPTHPQSEPTAPGGGFGEAPRRAGGGWCNFFVPDES